MKTRWTLSLLGILLTLVAGACPPSAHAQLPSSPADARARELLSTLHLEFLPGESGYFGAVEVSALDVRDAAGRVLKAHSSILYLLTAEAPTNFLHHLESDDVHILLEGGPVDYFLFHPDGRVEKRTLGRNLAAGEQPVISVPAGCWKALRLQAGTGFALMSNVLSPQWTPDRVKIGADAAWVSRYAGAAPWATEGFLRELIGPNWQPSEP